MSQDTKIIIIIGVVTVLLLGVGLFFLSSNQPKTTTNQAGDTVYQVDTTRGYKVGSDSAKVRLVEFGDLQCPACKAAESTVEKLINDNNKNPNFQFIWKHFPLSIHKNAIPAANAVEAVGAQGEDKFWAYRQKLYETQEAWSELADPSDYLANLAKQVGADDSKVKDAIKNNTYFDKIKQQESDGNAVGVNATPTFYLNGKKLEFTNFSDVENEVNSALK
jgi:protein-disulfide isomerase